MEILLFIAILVVLVSIFWQDLKNRAVSWYFFPLLFFFNFLYATNYENMHGLLLNTGINTVFIVLQLIMVSIYFSIKERQWVNITRKYLGIGDILFLFVIAPLFSPFVFILFYLISLILIVAVAGIMVLLKKYQSSIPLAGLQAIMLLSCLLANICFEQFRGMTILNISLP